MPGAARIGSLHAMLGLSTAEWDDGVKKAQSGLDRFVRGAKVGFGAIAVAATAAGAALSIAVKGAIDNADSMGELAQSVGVSVEALTSMGYAAKMSGSDTETLSTGLRRLSQSMLTVAQGGTGPMAMAFDALGVSVQTADGALRASDQVLLDVADKFARMEDGATKTAIAVQLFGRSGAELIPFLNQGRAGIGALTDEADRLGITISGTTANAAGELNDTLDRLQSTSQGVVNQITTAVLPALNEFGAKLADPQFAASAQTIAVAIVDGMKVAVDSINTVVGALNGLRNAMGWMNDHDMFGNPIDRGNKAGRGVIKFNTEDQAKALLAEALKSGNTTAPGSDFYAGIFAETAASTQQVATAFEPVITNSNAAAAGVSALKAAMSDGKAVFEATRTPAEAYGLEVERLNALLQKGAIDQDTYNRAVTQAQDSFQRAEVAGNQLASTLSSGLANVFSSVVDGSKTAVDAVGDLLKSLGQMMISQGFQALIGGAFGGGGGFGSILSSIFGGVGGGPVRLGFNLPGYADGTNFAPGGLALVGERGPELVNLPRGSQVIPNHELRAGGGGLTVHIDARGAQMGVAEQIDQWARFRLPGLVNQINSDPLARG